MNLHPTSLYIRSQSASSFVFDVPTGRSEQPLLAPSHTRGVQTPSISSDAIPEPETSGPASYIVISGGTGCNTICSAFGQDVCYVLPVSDNGGSSSEIIRVLGGPSIGDIRSRLIRLIPSAPPMSPSERIKHLLSFRFATEASEREARDLWRDIVEGSSDLWSGIPADRKETIRGFLVYFDGEVLKRANKRFSFRNASIGNFFLTAMHLFFRSVPSAIFLFSSITGSTADILPVLVTNHTVTIAAELKDRNILVGQCEISHPSRSSGPIIVMSRAHEDRAPQWDDSATTDAMHHEDATTPDNVAYTKQDDYDYDPLGSPINRVFYINQYGQEIYPTPNPLFLKNLGLKTVLVYSCGSLYTSIVPCLALQGVASSIARSKSLKAKVLLLNGKNDRETDEYSASDYIRGIANTLNRYDMAGPPIAHGTAALRRDSDGGFPISAFITHLVYLKATTIHVDVEEITKLGVACIEVESTTDPLLFDSCAVENAMDRVLSRV